MNKYAPWLVVAAVFWLGRAGAEDRSPSNRIVLSDGEWTTTILPGEIVLEGPDRALISLSMGSRTTLKGKPVTLIAPSVFIAGPLANGRNGGAATARMGTDGRGAEVILRGVPVNAEGMPRAPGKARPGAEKVRRTAPSIGIGAGHLGVNIRFKEGGVVLQDLPVR